MNDTQAVEILRCNPWLADATPGIVTVDGRTFHAGELCSGYQQGIRNTKKRGATPNPVQHVTAQKARDRGKAACRRCWRDETPIT
jgi:hypothetical protein